MVRHALVCFVFLSLRAFAAGEAMVTVLEAPMFEKPSREARVVQYARRGERVFVHGVVLVDRTAYGDLPEGERLSSEDPNDPFTLKPEIENYYDGSDFILSKDKLGRDVWLLKEHVFLLTGDRREFAQAPASSRNDPTDYRLLEPLPANYPLHRVKSIRGTLGLSLASPESLTYAYPRRITSEGYGPQLELAASMSKILSKDIGERWHVGGLGLLRVSGNEYRLQGRTSREDVLRLGGGPQLSFDAWSAERQRLVLSWAALVHFTQLAVSQTENASGDQEVRAFRGLNFASRIGGQWQWLNVLADADLFVGVWGEFEASSGLVANTDTNRPQWWNESRGSTYRPDPVFSFGAGVGFQSSY